MNDNCEEKCSHDCESCNCNGDCNCEGDCGGQQQQDLHAKLNPKSRVGKVIAVASGKGGVGKSLVTSMLAVLAARKGLKTAILDADVTGPSIPRGFGLNTKRAQGSDSGLIPVKTRSGIQIMSLNLLLDNVTDPVIWRGPIIAGAVSQFWTDVIWDDVDIMFVDMPPGTGDVPLTVFQSLPVDGVVIVTSPQELVGMIVEKAVRMTNAMEIPVSGIVENMSFFKCPDCGKVHSIYGDSHVDEIAARYEISTVAKLPIDPAYAKASDAGAIEDLPCEELAALADHLIQL